MIFSHIAVYIGSRKKYQIISLCHEHNAQHMSTIQMKFLRFILTVDQVSQPSHGHRHHYARPIPKRHMRHPVTRPPIRITTWKLYSLCNEMNRSTLRQGGLFKRQRTEVLEDAVYSCTEYVFGHFSPGKAWLQSRFGPEHTEWGDSKIWFQITRLKLRYAGKGLIRMPGETVKDGIITVLPGKKMWTHGSSEPEIVDFDLDSFVQPQGYIAELAKKVAVLLFGWKYIC